MKKSLCKHLLLLMIAVLSVASFASCKDDDDVKSIESQLVGTWVTRVYDSWDDFTITMVLNKDGKGLYLVEEEDDRETVAIKWSVVGDSLLSIGFGDEGYEETVSSFSLSNDGKTLTWNGLTYKKK